MRIREGMSEDGELSLKFYTSQLKEDYLKQFESVDINISDGEVVTIDLNEELPDASELSTLLTNENCGVETWCIIAKRYAIQGRFEDAMELIDEAFKSQDIMELSNQDKLSLNNLTTWIHILKKDLAKLTNESNIIQQINQLDFINLITTGWINILNGNNDFSFEIFDKILKVQPLNYLAMFGKAHILFARKNYHLALKLYQQILVVNPLLKPDPRIGIGLCYWFLKNKKLANQAWTNSLELQYSLDVEILRLIYEIDDALNNSENDEAFKESYKKLILQTDTYLQKDKSNPTLLLIISSYFFNLSNYEKVIKICSKILTSPSMPPQVISELNFWLARCYFVSQDFINSTKFYNESIKSNPANSLAKLGLVQSQIARKSVEELLISLENYLKTDPNSLEYNYIIGVLYYEKQQLKKSIYHLERTINLCSKSKEIPHINCYLILSEIYENSDLNKSIEFLSKTIEYFKDSNQEQPLELFNNIGVFHYLKGNLEISKKFFTITNDKIDINDDESRIIKITLEFNLARVLENFDLKESKELYNSTLQKLPSYLSAKLRLLFISCFDKSKDYETLNEEVNQLLSENQDILEVRSFYGWFIRKFGGVLKIDKDKESVHHKETLMKYDSHDSFALISLGNAYLSIAKEIKLTSKDAQDKRNQYLIRATQLFQKVISLDGKNLYATQGLAITFAEMKNYGIALEIFKKLKNNMIKTESTLNDISIYINLGNLLVSMKNFAKAIETYEQLLKISKDFKIYSLIGRAWLLRGYHEKNHQSFINALSNAENAYALNKSPSLSFNISFIQFQIAELIKNLPLQSRNIEMIENSIVAINEAITNLKNIANSPNLPFSKEELESRASMGSNTIIKQLDRILEEQKDYESNISEKLLKAKKIQEEEMIKKLALQKAKEEKEREEMMRMIEQRKKLEEESSQWLEQMVELENDENDVLSAAEDEEKPVKPKKEKLKKASKKRKIVSDDEEDEDSAPVTKKTNTGKKSSLSNDFVVDSDEGLSADDLDEDNLVDPVLNDDLESDKDLLSDKDDE